MTAVLRFPNTPADFQRLTERQREASRATKRAELLATAIDVLHDWTRREPKTVRAAIIVAGCSEDGYAIQMAAKVQFLLNRNERLERNAATRLETPREVAARHAHRWPALAVGSALVALVLLAGTGWL